MQTTARGTVVINSYIQEDKLYFPVPGLRAHAEAVVHSPLILAVENAHTIFHATTSGQCGAAYRELIWAVNHDSVGMALILDLADSSSSNIKNLRFVLSWLERSLRQPLRVLFHFGRCDAHQLHLAASIALGRSKVAGPLFSAATMLRVGLHKWKLRVALGMIIDEELQFEQGGDPSPDVREFILFVLRATLLRHLIEIEGAASDEELRQKQQHKDAQEAYIDKLAGILNFDWRIHRIGHRCRRLATGRWCCANRPPGIF